jgi:hypothetical protein
MILYTATNYFMVPFVVLTVREREKERMLLVAESGNAI